MSQLPGGSQRVLLRRATRASAGVGDVLGAVVLLALGSGLGWLRPELGDEAGPWRLPVRLPGWSGATVTYGVPVAVALVFAICGAASVAHGATTRNGPRWLLSASLLAVTAVLGCAVLTAITDVRTQFALQAGTADMATLTSHLPYAVPRFQVSQLLAHGLGVNGSLVASALRPGWYCALAGAAVLFAAAVRRFPRTASLPPLVRGGARRQAPSGTSARIALGVSAVALVIFLASIVRGEVAGHEVADAAGLTDSGHPAAALAAYQRALALDPDLVYSKSVAIDRGRAMNDLGMSAAAPAALATSREQLSAGSDIAALDTLRAAHRAHPADALVLDELRRQAVAAAQAHRAPGILRALIADPGVRNLTVVFTLGTLELQTGDYPAAAVDLRAVVAGTADTDIRSSALTYLSLAESDAGSTAAARHSIVEAVAADPDHNNVTARAMALGLYTARAFR